MKLNASIHPMTKIGINGFGRIGRLVFRAICDQGLLGKEIEVVAVNDLVPADNLAYLLKYDSTQGAFKGEVSSSKSAEAQNCQDDLLVVNGHKIKCLAIKEGPAALPWKQLGAEIVIEATGLFTDAAKAKGHIDAGAKKVIISAPGKNEDLTVVMGVNHEKYDPGETSHHFQRQLHDELSRARRPCAFERRLRPRRRTHDNGAQLHRHTEDGGRSFPEGLERRTLRSHQCYSIYYRSGQGSRSRHS